MIDDLGPQEMPQITVADRLIYWLPRVSLALGIIGVLIWWWVGS